MQGKKETNNDNSLKTLQEDYKGDVICLQETKCPGDCNVKDLPLYDIVRILDSKTKKGYSGVATFSNTKPIHIMEDFPCNEEGRVLCFEYAKFYLVNAYVPNSKADLSRLEYRISVWEKEMRDYLNALQKKKPVIYVGDLNVAPTNIDIHNPKGHENVHGFTPQEREAFAKLLEDCNLVDAYRVMHPTTKKYSWFSPFAKSRENNKGWRIDFVLVSEKLKGKIKECDILNEVFGSDHCPVLLDIDV